MVSPSTLSAVASLAAAGVAPAAAGAARAQRARPRPATPNVAAQAAQLLLSPATITGLVRAVRTLGARGARAGAVAGYATPAGTPSKADPLAFLKDRNLSIEEKLIRLLGYLNKKWDKEMQDKLDKIEAGERDPAAPAAAASPKKKKSGFFGSITGALKGMLGPAGIALEALKIPAVRAMVDKIGGPVLAAAASAMGFPQLAPLLLKYGPALVDVAASIGGAQAGGGSSGSGSGSTGSSSGGTKKMSDSERNTLVMEIQRIQQKQNEMFGLVSNILKAGHELRSSVINNIR